MSLRHQMGSWLVWLLPAMLLLFPTGGCDEDQASKPGGQENDGPVIAQVEADPVYLIPGEAAAIAVRVVRASDPQSPLAGVSVDFAEVGRQTQGLFVPSSANTDEEGWARTSYQPPQGEVGQLDVKAMTGSDVGYLSLFISADGPAQSGLAVVIDAEETSLPADGTSTLQLTVSVTAGGVGVSGKSVVLTAGDLFEDVDGDGLFGAGDELLADADEDGEWDAVGAVTSPVTTDGSGMASATYTAGAVVGELYIKATVDSAATDFEIELHSTQSRLTLSTSPLEAWADGYSQVGVTARVVDIDGLAVAGRLVRFTAGEPFEDLDGDGYYTQGVDTYTDLDENGTWDVVGTITSAALTGSDGSAAAVYTAGRRTGEVTIYASTRDGGSRAAVRLLELPRVDEADWSWDPASIYADGLSTTTLHMQLFDVNGTAIGGKEVTLAASAGQIASPVLSGADGRLTALYHAPETSGTITITASAGSWSLDMPLAVAALPAVGSLDLTVQPSEIWPDGLGDPDHAGLTATCRDTYGEPLPSGVSVLFTLVSGPGGGEYLNDPGVTSTTGRTDTQGRATVTLFAGELAGSVQVSATSGTAADQVVVEIAGETSVQQLTLTATETELYVLGVGRTDTALLEAACYLAPGVPAGAGVPVTIRLLAQPGGSPEATLVDAGAEAQLLTDAQGTARAVLRSGTHSGPVTVQASAAGLSQTLYLGISAGPPAGIECWAEEFEEDGTCPFIAAVHDLYHNPVPDGTVVVFSADDGLIYTEHGTGSAATANGYAAATYDPLPGGLQSTAVLTCGVDGAPAPLSCSQEIALPDSEDPPDPGPIARLTLALSSVEIAVRETGGEEQCRIVATCSDSDNLPVGAGREVEFEILAGPDGGEQLQDAGWGPVTSTTNASSEAAITLNSGTISGTVEVVARAGESASQSARVSIAAGPPRYISVGVSPLNIRGWDVVGAESEVVAYVSDLYNNPVRDGTVVYFTCDEGILRGNYLNTGALGSSVTEGGVAIGTYFSGLPRLDGQVAITATTAGGTVIGTGGLISSGPPNSVRFLSPAPPVSMLANGTSDIELWVEVLDLNENFVVGGTRVEWRADFGDIDDASETADGVYGSVASAILSSAPLDQDYSWSVPDDGIGAHVTVTAAAGLAGSAADALDVAFRTGSAYRGNSRIEIETTIPAGSSVPFEVLIADRYGNPLGGHVLELSATGGAAVTAQGTTDSWGSAYPMIFTAPASDTTCVVTVHDADPGYGGLTLTARVTIQ